MVKFFCKPNNDIGTCGIMRLFTTYNLGKRKSFIVLTLLSFAPWKKATAFTLFISPSRSSSHSHFIFGFPVRIQFLNRLHHCLNLFFIFNFHDNRGWIINTLHVVRPTNRMRNFILIQNLNELAF
ncbi:Uncharacterised protein [Legionella pneumophila]|nr:Uncharacterised protein [Legionella pneumophila]